MKPIELTEEHKSKLLEMCNKLFPGYKWQFNSDYSKGILWNDCVIESLLKWKVKGKNSQVLELNIHWFEFCMIYLYRKIIVLSNFTFQTEDFYQTVLVDYHNPIDYLYEEFKKLKK